jgi:hypothetical protein
VRRGPAPHARRRGGGDGRAARLGRRPASPSRTLTLNPCSGSTRKRIDLLLNFPMKGPPAVGFRDLNREAGPRPPAPTRLAASDRRLVADYLRGGPNPVDPVSRSRPVCTIVRIWTQILFGHIIPESHGCLQSGFPKMSPPSPNTRMSATAPESVVTSRRPLLGCGVRQPRRADLGAGQRLRLARADVRGRREGARWTRAVLPSCLLPICPMH